MKTIIVSGTSVQSSRLSQQLVEEHSPTFDLYFTAGVHPHAAKVLCLHCHDKPVLLCFILVAMSLRLTACRCCASDLQQEHTAGLGADC